MPYLYETYKYQIPRKYDRRVKITEAQKAEIRFQNEAGMSLRAIARNFSHICSRRSIQFILYPDRIVDNIRARHLRLKKDPQRYYNKETWPSVISEHRKYKDKIFTTTGAKQTVLKAQKENRSAPVFNK